MAKSKLSQLEFGINRLWPVFHNAELEQQYCRDNFERNKTSIAKGLLGVYLFVFLFAFAELFIEFSEPSAADLSMVIKLAMLPMGWLFYQVLLNQKEEKTLYICTIFFYIIYLVLMCYQLYLYVKFYEHPPNSFELSVPFSYLTLLLYMFAPLRVEVQVCISVFIAASFWLLVDIFYPLGDARFSFGFTYVVLSNIFGLMASYYINKSLRTTWAKSHQLKIKNQVLEQEVTHRKELELKFKQLAMTDSLTGVENRRSFLKHLGRELAKSKRVAIPTCLVMFDVDHFKAINDSFGHAIGDKVLIAVVNTVLTRIRSTDVLGRIGGEEFGIILPNSDLVQAAEVAEQLRQALENMQLEELEQDIKVTASFGVAVNDNDDQASILKRADLAMYQAKELGRNRVELGRS